MLSILTQEDASKKLTEFEDRLNNAIKYVDTLTKSGAVVRETFPCNEFQGFF
jgi:hypothetical protein